LPAVGKMRQNQLLLEEIGHARLGRRGCVDEQVATERILALYDSLCGPLLRYAIRSCGSPDVAEDIVQEVFMRLYRTLREGQRVDNPRAWAFAVVRREIGKWATEPLGRAAMQPLEILDSLPAGNSAPDMRAIERSELERLFGVLTHREEEVLLLRLGALKYREIADQLRISTKSVCTMLARALRKLQRAANAEPRLEEQAKSHVGSRAPKTLQ